MGSWWWWWCAWWRVIRCGVGSSESACGGGGGQWDRPRMRQTLIHIPGHSVATGGQRHIHPPADCLRTLHWTQQVAAAQKIFSSRLRALHKLHSAHCPPHYLCKECAQNAHILVCHHKKKPKHIHWTVNSKCQTYPHTHSLDLKFLQTTMSELDWRKSTDVWCFHNVGITVRPHILGLPTCVTPSPPLLVL